MFMYPRKCMRVLRVHHPRCREIERSAVFEVFRIWGSRVWSSIGAAALEKF